MGLLDDAIRDHLELKRLRGADPGEVAREQKEALTPVLDDEAAATADEPVLVLEDFNLASDQPAGPELAKGGQETAELDMRTVLGEGQSPSSELAGPEGSGIAAASPRASNSTPADPDTTIIR
jgi:hypothetical protein